VCRTATPAYPTAHLGRMTDSLNDLYPDRKPCPPPVERAPCESRRAVAATGEHSRWSWLDKWAPPCPDGNLQIVRSAEGFRERNRCELELRVLLGCGFDGACNVVLDEQPTAIFVRVLLCASEDEWLATRRDRHYMDCPVRVWLEHPIADRAVIDVDTDKELDEFRPYIVGTTRQPDGGYHPSNRRR
jgi:hypothetical protein